MRIGVLGGTGPAGQAVAVQFAGIGIEAVVGSRSKERADQIVGELQERWSGRDLPLVGGDNEAAAGADVVVVATPWDGVQDTIDALKEQLDGKLVISMANAMTKWGKRIVPLIPPSGSITQVVADALPGARVAGAFHHMPAGPWADLDHPLDADVMVCARTRAIADEAIELIDQLPGLRGVHAGGFASAMAVEALTASLVSINRRYKTHASIKLNGLDG